MKCDYPEGLFSRYYFTLFTGGFTQSDGAEERKGPKDEEIGEEEVEMAIQSVGPLSLTLPNTTV